MRFAWIAFIFIAIAGCNKDDTSNLKRDAGALAHSAGVAAVDAGLAAKVNAALLQAKGVDIKGLHVEAKNGAVMVGGHVKTEEERHLVVETVKGVEGVKSVDAQLRIVPEAKQ
jgi:hyperosmotically inducible protein